MNRLHSRSSRLSSPLLATLLLLALPACGSGEGGEGGGATTGGSGGQGGEGGQGGSPSDVPLIGEVLDCGKTNVAGSLSPGTDASQLVRHDLDTSVFPDALCNDGTTAAFYYRPAASAADADKWVIQLQGGGSCESADECAQRWCNEGTNFSMVGMSTTPAPGAGIDGHGILKRNPVASDSPIEGYNQVFVKYCSSDFWMGAGRDVVLDGHHPITMEPATYRAHFLGRKILDATLKTLRQDGVPALTYGGSPMPSLDGAKVVLLAGASAGGAGAANNGDYVGDLLRETNPGLEEYGLLIDSIFGPDRIEVGFQDSVFCTGLGLCTAEAVMGAQLGRQDATWKPLREQSCLAAHPNEAWRCTDTTHLILHHVTSPMFVRMGLTDDLISDPYLEHGLTDASGTPFDLQLFGLTVRSQLLALANLKTTAEESAGITVAPGAFGPVCAKHETLRSDGDIFGVTIDPGAGPRTMFDVFTAWRGGAQDQQIVTSSMTDTVCAP
jgi:hypothetical protein